MLSPFLAHEHDLSILHVPGMNNDNTAGARRVPNEPRERHDSEGRADYNKSRFNCQLSVKLYTKNLNQNSERRQMKLNVSQNFDLI